MIKIEVKNVKVNQLSDLMEIMDLYDMEYNLNIQAKKTIRDYIKENKELKNSLKKLMEKK